MSRKKLSKKELEKLTKENSKDNNKETPKDSKIIKFFSSRKNVVMTGLILLLTVSIVTPLIVALNKKPQKPKEDTEVVIVDGDSRNKSPETIKETTREHRVNKPHRRQPKETVVRETAKETQKETKKETITETPRETKKETLKETDEEIIEVAPRKETHKETQQETVRTTETQLISFNTIDNYASTGGKSRVYQEGRNGERTIVKEDGKIVSNTITRKPQDKIIERYVKVQDKKIETRKVEDKNSPIYDYKSRDRWFVSGTINKGSEWIPIGGKVAGYTTQSDGRGGTFEMPYGTLYFYSAKEASDYMTNNEVLGNWGTAEPELIKGDLIGYDKVKKEVVVQEEKWEWKH